MTTEQLDLSRVRIPKRKPGRPKARRETGCTPRIQAAIDAMIWDGLPLDQAAAVEGARLSTRSLREALNKPEVLTYYKAQIAAIRTAAQAGNARAVLAIRDSTDLPSTAAGANAVINAAAYLDGPREDRSGPNINIGISVQQTAPGYQIDLSKYDPAEMLKGLRVAGSAESVVHERLIADQREGEAKPLIEHASVARDDGQRE